VQLTSPSSVQHTSGDGTSLAFTFDSVHGQATSQQQMFAQVQDIVRAVLQGQNGSIIAYGQTGAFLRCRFRLCHIVCRPCLLHAGQSCSP
jgi:DNA replication protein DnaC